jgi:hypothetical protein
MPTIHGSPMARAIEIEVEDSPHATVVVMPGLLPALITVGLLGLLLAVLRRRRARELSAREILDRRLALGELTPQQYEKLRGLIDQPHGSVR